jgi:MHS family proline/betaine transporter-like MFS transporter
MPTYLSQIVSPPVEHALMINTLSMILLIAVIPLAGALSDIMGRKNLLLAATAIMGVSVYPLFLVLDQATMAVALVVQLFFAVLIGVIQGPMPALLVEMFPARFRYTSVGICYNICLALFGGTSPLVSTWLIQCTGNIASPAIYLTLLAALSLVGLSTLKTGKNRQLRPEYQER